jgi:hypothetical protein
MAPTLVLAASRAISPRVCCWTGAGGAKLGLFEGLVQLLVELIRLRGELVRYLDVELADTGNVDRGRRGRGDRGHRARSRGQRTHDQRALDRIRQLGFSLQAVLTHRATSPILVLSRRSGRASYSIRGGRLRR